MTPDTHSLEGVKGGTFDGGDEEAIPRFGPPNPDPDTDPTADPEGPDDDYADPKEVPPPFQIP